MRRTEKQMKNRKRWTYRLIAIAVMVSAIAGLLSQTVFAQNSYVITDGGNVTVYKTHSKDPEAVLDEAGIELSEEDTYTTTYNDGGCCIEIQRMQTVTVDNQGNRSVINTYGEPVSELLDRMGIVLGEKDVLSCDGDMKTYDGMTVKVVRKDVRRLQYDSKVPYETKYYEDPELAPGQEIVLIEGAEGLVHYDAEVTYENGIEVYRNILEETVISESVTRLVVRGPNREITSQPGEKKVPLYAGDSGVTVTPNADSGSTPAAPANPTPTTSPASTETPTTVPTSAPETTAPPSRPIASGGTLTTSSGMTYTYTDAITVSCTAYSCGGSTGYTYSGTLARVGAVATDPSVIPLGTRMYIVSNDGQYIYGYCVAEDIGGGIKGYKIDLYFDTFSECWAFGVRTCTAYILK